MEAQPEEQGEPRLAARPARRAAARLAKQQVNPGRRQAYGGAHSTPV